MAIELDEIVACMPGAGGADGGGGRLDASHITVNGPERVAASAFDVDGILMASAGYAVAAADRLGVDRGVALEDRAIDLEHLLAYCTTHVEVDGEPVPAWADLSGVYSTAGGRHLQVHCNFEHHAAGVVRQLGCARDRDAVAAAIAQRDAFELEAALISDGMIAAVIRTLDEWDAHPHAVATRELPLMSIEQIGEADPIAAVLTADGALSGLRVLDCSRVLAGPVAGQMLALSGADVLRVGAAHLPSIPVGVMSTGFGKRNALLDLRTAPGGAAMGSLIDGADVWIDAYRPGAFEQLGWPPQRAAQHRPGIVVVQISGFDWTGPWAGRRGFDSIVQSTTGVRWAGGVHAVDESGASLERGPTGLPVQALDYAAGFLAAGVAAQLVAHQRRVGGSWLARVSLLRVRDWLVRRGGPNPYQPSAVGVDPRFLSTVDSEFGSLTAVRPFAGDRPAAPRPLGTSDASWLS